MTIEKVEVENKDEADIGFEECEANVELEEVEVDEVNERTFATVVICLVDTRLCQ